MQKPCQNKKGAFSEKKGKKSIKNNQIKQLIINQSAFSQ